MAELRPEQGIKSDRLAAVTSFAGLPPIDRDRSQLWFLDIGDAAVDASALALLPPEAQYRAAQFHFEQDRASFVRSHGFLRILLAAHLHCPPAEVLIVQPKGAKPALARAQVGQAGLRFNLSHSGPWALVGLSRAEIGVDVEMIRPMADCDAIARDNFAAAEVEALAALPPQLRENGFFACWTRKEAYVKGVGLGLAAPLGSFVVSVAPEHRAKLLSIDGNAADAERWTLWAGQPGRNAQAAAAVEAQDHGFDAYRFVP